MVRFDLRLHEGKVQALRRLAGRLTYQGDGSTPVRWTDLVRLGIEWVLTAEGDPAKMKTNNATKEME